MFPSSPPAPDVVPGVAAVPPAISFRRLLDLFIVSFTILFFELTCIRWFASTVIFLTFFTNLVLMACFLGMSVGCLAASRRSMRSCGTVLPLDPSDGGGGAGAFAWMPTATTARWRWMSAARSSPQMVYFGTEYRANGIAAKFLIPVEADRRRCSSCLIALMFIGLGQTLGRCVQRRARNRIGGVLARTF